MWHLPQWGIKMQIDKERGERGEKGERKPGRKGCMCWFKLINPRNPISPQYQGDGEASWEECQKKNPLRIHVNNRRIYILWLLTDQCAESDRFLCLRSKFRTFVTSFSYTQTNEPVRENIPVSIFHVVLFSPPVPCHWLPFFSKWKGNAGMEHKKGARTISNSGAPPGHSSSRENHMVCK